MKSRFLFFFPAIGLLCCLAACDYSRYRYDFFEGNWVLQNYFDSVKTHRSNRYDTLVMPMELVFRRHVDSVYLFYGYGDTGRMYAFDRQSSNNIRVHTPAPLSMFMTKSARYIKYRQGNTWLSFVKVAPGLVDSSGGFSLPLATHRVLRAVTLTGKYRGADNSIVRFLPHGKVLGLPGFDRYRVTYGEGPGMKPVGNVLLLGNKAGETRFTWEWERQELRLYELNGEGKPNRVFTSLTRVK